MKKMMVVMTEMVVMMVMLLHNLSSKTLSYLADDLKIESASYVNFQSLLLITLTSKFSFLFFFFNLSVASGATLSPPVRGLNGLSGAATARWRPGGLMSPSLKCCSVCWGDLRSLTKPTEPFP